ncbi:MAG: radical SAM protein [Myxococcales bacterium]|nr:MAG: radical SAM protein [Myxococcales bacterium]
MTDVLNSLKSGAKVLLLNAPVSDTATAEKMGMIASEAPFGLLRIGAYFRQRGCRVEWLDALRDPLLNGRLRRHVRKILPCGSPENGASKEIYHYGLDSAQLARRLAEFDAPDAIAISANFTWHSDVLAETIQTCKSVFPKTKTILGGNFPTVCPEEAARTGADQVFSGDIEEARFLPTAIDLMPGPYHEDYLRMIKGCPYKCSYCITNCLNGGHVYAQPPEKVFAELIDKRDRFGVKTFIFNDDFVLFQQKKYLDPFLDMVIQEKPGAILQFPLGFSAHIVTEPFIARMRQAGVETITLALETISERRARAMNRPHHIREFVRAVDILKAHGYKGRNIRVFCLIGLPDQTLDEILKTICFLFHLGIMPSLTTYTLTPGSGDMERFKDRIQWNALDELSPDLWRFANPEMRAGDLERTYRYFHEKYYPLERIVDSPTDDPVIVAMQKIVRSRGHLPENL